MPIYEFYCSDCHVIFNFRSAKFDTSARPGCPRCGRPNLERQISLFAVSRGRPESDDDGLSDLDESAMEQAMLELEREAGAVDEDDPRAVARVMRKLYDTTGLRLGDGMAEAIRRMEAGDDPEKIEQEMGDLLDDDLPGIGGGKLNLRQFRQRFRPPIVDDTLYEL